MDAPLKHEDFLKMHRDYEQSAKVAALVYVSDQSPGINRIKKGKGFCYVVDGQTMKDRKEIERIRKLAIPPAWKNVWICPVENGHIQATGFDLRNRKQYRYHTLWHTLRHETKFHRLYEFGKALPALRLQVEKDINRKDLCQEKVIALVIAVMERTYIRIGNSGYEKLYGSYGLTTLKDKHVSVEGSAIQFSFKGKKGITHKIQLKNRKLAKIMKECREIPGKELFQYFDENGNRSTIDSGAVNNYLKQHSGMDCTAKDFRTWAGSLQILWAFKSVGEAINETERKRKITEALDHVSQKLGNTRTVCRKYYVHPGLINLYEENNLRKYLDRLDDIETDDNISGLTVAEEVLMRVLKDIRQNSAAETV